MAERLACCVPFCRRTFRQDKAGTPWPEGSQVICGKHWRLASATMRRRYSRLKRLHARGITSRHGRRPYHLNVAYVVRRCFERIVKQAIERAAGIA
ncbi:MAG TPA: hypothetical protein VK630_15910 [Reyranella sp.]|nr:hypothetical protein [Reyranella sp.]